MQSDPSEQLVGQLLKAFQHSAPSNPLSIAENETLRSHLHHILKQEQGRQQSRDIETKQMSILLSDLRGFTAIAENYSAHVMMDLLNRYFCRMSEVIEVYGGSIDKYMGDSIMVLFGANETEMNDLQRTLCCAVEMQLAMAGFNKENEALGLPHLFMGIGVNTGQVVAGNIGSNLHREYTVIGDEVNLTSRIEAHSLRGQILISESAYELAKDFVSVGEAKEVFVKGKRRQVKLFELLATHKPGLLKVPRQEGRSSPRVAVDLALEYSVIKRKMISPEVLQGRIIDISYHGIRAILPEYLPPMTDIKFSLSLSLTSNERCDVYAKALRVKQLQEGHLGQFEFTDIDAKGQKALAMYVDNVLDAK